jgi:hypothetical protein
MIVMMAKPFYTLRRVGLALDAHRNDIVGEFVNIKRITGGLVTTGLLVSATPFTTIDGLENASSHSTVILECDETQVNNAVQNAGAVKEFVKQLAPSAATPILRWDGCALFMGCK